jgi:hypothetical protein
MATTDFEIEGGAPPRHLFNDITLACGAGLG